MNGKCEEMQKIPKLIYVLIESGDEPGKVVADNSIKTRYVAALKKADSMLGE